MSIDNSEMVTAAKIIARAISEHSEAVRKLIEVIRDNTPPDWRSDYKPSIGGEGDSESSATPTG